MKQLGKYSQAAAILIASALAAGLATSAMAAELVELRIGMGLPKPPYILTQGNGGLDCEMAGEALRRAGYKMVPLQYPPMRALAMMSAHQLDGILSITDGIGGQDYFSDAYIVYRNVAITLASKKIRIDSITDLASYSVSAFQNAHLLLGDPFKSVVNDHLNYKEHAQQIIQNRLLYTGRVDVVIADQYIFKQLNSEIGTQIDVRQPIVFHHIFSPTPRQAVFRDRVVRDKFNAALKTMRRDGTSDALYKKYGMSVVH